MLNSHNGFIYKLNWRKVSSFAEFANRFISTNAAWCKAAEQSSPDYEVCTIDTCMINPCAPEPSIIIIGGGIAGLSAAQRLSQCGITNYTILEATDRPGGRIHSCWLGDVIAEMGAQYIEGGCMANPIFTLACQEGLLTPPLVRPDPTRGLFCTSDGRAIDLPVSLSAYHTFRQIESEANALYTLGVNTRSHGNLLNFLGLRIQQELHNFPADQRYDAARVMYGMINLVRNRCGDDLALVSADQFGSSITIPGGNVRVPLGYIGVIAPLLRELPENSITYSKPVKNIQWGEACESDGPRAIVHCDDGEKIPADYVICTISLGVLKNQIKPLFSPPLPACKMEAIDRIGFGNVNKIFLEYARPFWVWREGGIRFAWSSEELAERDDWTKGLSSVEELEGSKRVLCAWVSGREATEMEYQSDEDVAHGITRILRQFTGDPCLPYPSSILRSKWGTDPYFSGAYSYMGLHTTIKHQCDLAAPIAGSTDDVTPVILFGGEATCTGHYSTVHGARLSGIREAERIVALTKKFAGPPRQP